MIVTLTGPNSFLLRDYLHGLVDGFVQEHGDIALEKIDGQDVSFDRLVDSLKSLPFLASKKMVVIREPGTHKQFAEQIKDLLESVPDTTDVIIVEPKLDKRLVYYKTLKTKTDFHEFLELDPRGLSNWLVQEAKNRHGSLVLSDASFLVGRLGINQELLAHELDKLLLFNPIINRQSIELLTEPNPQSTVFELLEAMFIGNHRQTLQLYKEQRAQKVEPQYIVAMLAWQLHLLALTLTAGQRTSEQVSKEASLNPFVIRKTFNLARKVSLPKLKELVHDALKLDIRLKSENIDADEAVQYFLLTVTF